MVKFSLIVPVYNVEDYLERCVNSILSQKYKSFEVILVDDGSTDNSGKLCDEFEKKDSRIKVYHKKNGGLSDARNYGIKYAKGEYIWFIDSDDYINTIALEILAKKVKFRNSYDIVLFDYYRDQEGNITKCNDRFKWNDKNELVLFSCSAWSKIFKRNFFVKNNYSFLKGRIYEDLELIPYIYTQTNKIGYVNDYLYYYFIRNDSIMHQKSFNIKKDDKFIVLEELKNKFIENKLYDTYKDEIIYLYIRHLIFVYSSEILEFDRKIYYIRLKRVLDVLNDLNIKWYENKYLLSSSFSSKLYCRIFRFKLFRICKLLIKIKK